MFKETSNYLDGSVVQIWRDCIAVLQLALLIVST